ncbi:hypothetical protein RHGRI_036591 [Rhododendron griersonianum]|uniref:Uncharacterized protein n=1 Tax=Rhododendron griersonianum TaxID=479676 RepID=A0AAV6HNG4_9ERIC|nr:hypothetical protein RHGRI_036591 [Rhododendron griersonianum]
MYRSAVLLVHASRYGSEIYRIGIIIFSWSRQCENYQEDLQKTVGSPFNYREDCLVLDHYIGQMAYGLEHLIPRVNLMTQ